MAEIIRIRATGNLSAEKLKMLIFKAKYHNN